jgi:hypothetical protein
MFLVIHVTDYYLYVHITDYKQQRNTVLSMDVLRFRVLKGITAGSGAKNVV